MLRDAGRIIAGSREKTHGPAERGVALTAAIWSAMLGIEIKPHVAALMMDANKTARIMAGDPRFADHYIDKAGWTAKAFELAIARRE